MPQRAPLVTGFQRPQQIQVTVNGQPQSVADYNSVDRITGLIQNDLLALQNNVNSIIQGADESLFIGYFTNGGDVSAAGNAKHFTSPSDGHQFVQAEVLRYEWSMVSTRTAGAGFTQGQLTRPALANANSGAGQLYWLLFDIDLTTLKATTTVSYFDGAEHITTDGLIKVTAVCRRAG